MLNVNKPLRRTQRIRNREGAIVKIEYKCERLPYFCFLCGLMGHGEKDCDVAIDDEQPKMMGWGVWIKASLRKGATKHKEEISNIKANRKSLFITKDAGNSVGGQEMAST
ncbi:Zinc finger CCHC domain-containing protein 9 [Bienertia sinuspersici]